MDSTGRQAGRRSPAGLALMMETAMSWPHDAPDQPPWYPYTVDFCRSKCWALNIRCAGCARHTVWSCERQAALPQALTLAALAKSAACTACGHVGADVYLTQDHGAAQAANTARIAAAEAARRI